MTKLVTRNIKSKGLVLEVVELYPEIKSCVRHYHGTPSGATLHFADKDGEPVCSVHRDIITKTLYIQEPY